jgi:hypothetical protein
MIHRIALALACVCVMAAAPDETERYVMDPHAGVWLHGPNLPSPRQDAAAAVLGGRIYVIGGFGAGGNPTDTTFVLEPAPGTNLAPSPDQPPAPTLPVGTWSTVRPIPEVIDHAAAATLDGYIYVAGGTVEKLVTNKFWRYDPASDSWASLPPLPIPRYAPTMQPFDGKLYVIGGTSSHGHDELAIEVYDPATAAWSLIQDALSVEREASATALFGGRIALVGGRDREERNQSDCDLFDPAHDAWSSCSNLHGARSGFGLAAIDDRLFAIGGVNVLTGLTTQTTEISGAGGRGWTDGHWMPAPRQGMSIAAIGHTVWVIGGSNWDANSPTSSVLRYVIPLVKVKFGGRPPQ